MSPTTSIFGPNRMLTLLSLGVVAFLFVRTISASMAVRAASWGHYRFAWAGDRAGKGEDFIAIIDADPASADYGRVVASAASGIRTQQVHHTEYWMPESGLLFANDHMAGRTVVMDVRDPLHPQVHASFGDIGGFSHPHSFLRLPNGHVLASFQVEGHMDHGVGDTAGMPIRFLTP